MASNEEFLNDNDLIFGNDGDDLIDGGVGDDTLTGQGGISTSFNLQDVTSPIDGGIVADVSVDLDYADGINSNAVKDVAPIGNYIEDFLANYPVEAGLYEVLNRDLTEALLNDSELGLSEDLDSISVNLDVEPKIIPFEFDSTFTQTDSGEINDVVSFEVANVKSQIYGGIVADISVDLDFADGIDPSAFQDVIPIGSFIEDFFADYSVESLVFYETINRDLTEALLSNSEIGLSGVLDSISVNLDIAPNLIPFEYETTTTQTDNGEINDVVTFQLEDVASPIDGANVTDVSVQLNYAEGTDSSDFRDVVPVSEFIEDFIANYSVEANNYIGEFLGNFSVEPGFYEVLNRDLTEALLNNSELGLSGVLDSISINLDVEPKIIPFEFDSTTTQTDSGEINDVVSFELENVTSPIVSASVSDVSIELDYVDGIDPSGFKDVIPLSDFVEDYLTNYSNPNDSIEVVNNNLNNALLTDSNLGLSEVLDSLTITLAPSPGVIPFPSENTVTLTPDETTIFGESDPTTVI
ncbi:conserved hypothetical protein [Hyella patelloides LEGE 07179]|uniref:Calcium-binding protein n=1 Tax=Hyella patelloides LEGE 07179 TaxID=945734 RepID=A0A563VRC3_9CYAN|nr:hypothetical protein [Hyella patelloides]VEP14008.1 conserved hypothetical protein [Hyella patelloides LEGE 07179]